MGALVHKIISPFTGRLEPEKNESYFFISTAANRIKWNTWWNKVKQSQVLTFLLVEGICLILLMLLGHSLLLGKDVEFSFSLIKVEGSLIQEKAKYAGMLLFYLMVFAVFFTSTIGVLDHVSRLSSDIFSNCLFKKKTKTLFLESSVYFIVLWLVVFFSIVVLLIFKINDKDKDLVKILLSITGVISTMVMFFYSILIFLLNIKMASNVEKFDAGFKNNNPFKMTLWRKSMLLISIFFYGFLSFLVMYKTFRP